MPRFAAAWPLVLVALAAPAQATDGGATRYSARIVSRLDGQPDPIHWVELAVEGGAEDAQRVCRAIVELETRSVDLEGKHLRARVERACGPEPLPPARGRKGISLRSRDGLPTLELLMAGIATEVTGELVSFSAMRSEPECQQVRRKLEAQEVENAAAASASAHEFLADELADREVEAKLRCGELEAAKRKPRAHGMRTRLHRLIELDHQARLCDQARRVAAFIRQRALEARVPSAPAARAALACIRE